MNNEDDLARENEKRKRDLLGELNKIGDIFDTGGKSTFPTSDPPRLPLDDHKEPKICSRHTGESGIVGVLVRKVVNASEDTTPPSLFIRALPYLLMLLVFVDLVIAITELVYVVRMNVEDTLSYEIQFHDSGRVGAQMDYEMLVVFMAIHPILSGYLLVTRLKSLIPICAFLLFFVVKIPGVLRWIIVCMVTGTDIMLLSSPLPFFSRATHTSCLFFI